MKKYNDDEDDLIMSKDVHVNDIYSKSKSMVIVTKTKPEYKPGYQKKQEEESKNLPTINEEQSAIETNDFNYVADNQLFENELDSELLGDQDDGRRY